MIMLACARCDPAATCMAAQSQAAPCPSSYRRLPEVAQHAAHGAYGLRVRMMAP
jgi:hypothetical protein